MCVPACTVSSIGKKKRKKKKRSKQKEKNKKIVIFESKIHHDVSVSVYVPITFFKKEKTIKKIRLLSSKHNMFASWTREKSK